ncbi:MAG: hypothetical protein FJX25_09935 [Alphaproteobacteria bacterium]|nr:hypothetical protein [Alphaproteobacteria bacterium]
MILIAGGHADPNLTVLVRRLVQRGVKFCDARASPASKPDVTIDLLSRHFYLNDVAIAPAGCFIRHDVFLQNAVDPLEAETTALNWYQTIRGWTVSQPGIRLFNRHSNLRENSKIQNLLLASDLGLSVPPTVVSTQLLHSEKGPMIRKPVAGGDYTVLLEREMEKNKASFPYFLQPRLNRPELRVYLIGPQLTGFWLEAADLDYRRTHDVTIKQAELPAEIGEGMLRLCERLDLDFAAADFMPDKDGILRFLEINTQPMFAAFDQVADGRLCDAIINYLTE